MPPVARARLRHAPRRHPSAVRATSPRQTDSLSTCVAAGGRTGVLGEGDALLENTPVRWSRSRRPIASRPAGGRAAARCGRGPRRLARDRGADCRRGSGAMRARFGTRPADLHAAIGPGIGECCYEVGPEVAAQFGEQGRAHIDLAAENRRQLVEAGVTPERIYASNLCTMCRPEEFHSFRRDKEAAGRLYSFAGIFPGSGGTVRERPAMFTWICPQCGREVPPAYKDCPDCAKKTAPAERVGAAPNRRRQPHRSQSPPQYAAAAITAPPPPQPNTSGCSHTLPPQPPPWRPLQRGGLPTWLLTVLFAFAFLGLGSGSTGSSGAARGSDATPRPQSKARRPSRARRPTRYRSTSRSPASGLSRTPRKRPKPASS